jgi:hypothetical protein
MGAASRPFEAYDRRPVIVDREQLMLLLLLIES